MKSEKDIELLKQLGLHVKKIRQDKGLSHRQVAAACNLEHHRIIEIEQGKVNITYTTLVELAQGLGVMPIAIIPEDE